MRLWYSAHVILKKLVFESLWTVVSAVANVIFLVSSRKAPPFSI